MSRVSFTYWMGLQPLRRCSYQKIPKTYVSILEWRLRLFVLWTMMKYNCEWFIQFFDETQPVRGEKRIRRNWQMQANYKSVRKWNHILLISVALTQRFLVFQMIVSKGQDVSIDLGWVNTMTTFSNIKQCDVFTIYETKHFILIAVCMIWTTARDDCFSQRLTRKPKRHRFTIRSP